MREHATIIADAGGPQRVHEQLGLSLHTVRSWVQRKRIPPEYWPVLVEHGAATLDELTQTHRPRKRPESQPHNEAA